MGQTKTTRSISATGLFLLIMMTVGLFHAHALKKTSFLLPIMHRM